MPPRQTVPVRWLVADSRLGERLWPALKRLPPGTGVLVLRHGLESGPRQRLLVRLQRLARARRLILVDERKGDAARVHNPREIRQARLSGARLLFVSPLYATRSHPLARPLPRMRAAALARLAGPRPLALGGMDERRFSAVRRLGFGGWAGIDAWTARIRT